MFGFGNRKFRNDMPTLETGGVGSGGGDAAGARKLNIVVHHEAPSIVDIEKAFDEMFNHDSLIGELKNALTDFEPDENKRLDLAEKIISVVRGDLVEIVREDAEKENLKFESIEDIKNHIKAIFSDPETELPLLDDKITAKKVEDILKRFALGKNSSRENGKNEKSPLEGRFFLLKGIFEKTIKEIENSESLEKSDYYQKRLDGLRTNDLNDQERELLSQKMAEYRKEIALARSRKMNLKLLSYRIEMLKRAMEIWKSKISQLDPQKGDKLESFEFYKSKAVGVKRDNIRDENLVKLDEEIAKSTSELHDLWKAKEKEFKDSTSQRKNKKDITVEKKKEGFENFENSWKKDFENSISKIKNASEREYYTYRKFAKELYSENLREAFEFYLSHDFADHVDSVSPEEREKFELAKRFAEKTANINEQEKRVFVYLGKTFIVEKPDSGWDLISEEKLRILKAFDEIFDPVKHEKSGYKQQLINANWPVGALGKLRENFYTHFGENIPLGRIELEKEIRKYCIENIAKITDKQKTIEAIIFVCNAAKSELTKDFPQEVSAAEEIVESEPEAEIAMDKSAGNEVVVEQAITDKTEDIEGVTEDENEGMELFEKIEKRKRDILLGCFQRYFEKLKVVQLEHGFSDDDVKAEMLEAISQSFEEEKNDNAKNQKLLEHVFSMLK